MVRAVALARRAVLVDHHVPELAAVAGRTVVELPVEHDPAADAGPEREHDHVVAPLPGPDPGLGQARHVGVVVDLHGQVQPRGHLGDERNVGDGHVDRVGDPPAALIDLRRQAEADRCGARVAGDPPHELLDLRPAARSSSEMSVGAASCASSSRSADTSAAFTDVPPRSTPTTGPGEEFTIVGTIKRARCRPSRSPPSRIARTAGAGPEGATTPTPRASTSPDGPRARRRLLARRRPRACPHPTCGRRGRRCPGGGSRPRRLRAAPGTRAGLLPAAVAPDPGDRDPGRPPALRVLALPGLPGLLRRGRQGEQAHRQADEGGARAGGEHPARPADQPRHGLGQPRARAPSRERGPTRSCSSAPTRASTSSRCSRSRATCTSRSPATARTRSTPHSRSAGRRF